MTSLSALDPLAWLDQGEEEVDVRLLLARRELVVPLTGAGVSRGAGVPTSAELAAEMLAWTDDRPGAGKRDRCPLRSRGVH
jgi:hypothetical protein